MKRILILILLVFTLLSFGKSEEIKLKKYGNSEEDLIPEDWNILSSVFGDLNKDGVDDLVFVIQHTDSRNIRINEKTLGSNKVDLNPRILAIYFKDSNLMRFEKKIQSNEFIILRDSPTMNEPFEGVEITKHGVLKINFNFWYSAGSWSTSNHIYKFRYNNNHFNLVGYDKYKGNRSSGETINYSINFLTQKMSISKGNFSDDRPELVEWKEFRLKNLKTLKSIKRPFEWEFMGIYL